MSIPHLGAQRPHSLFQGFWPMSYLRHHQGLILAFCVITPAYLIWTWNDQIGALDSDGPSYLMMAQHYSTDTANNSIISIAASFSRFPPLYPLVLAYLHVADNLRMAHAVTTGFFMLALVAMYRWLSGEGLSQGQASLLVLLFAAMPGSWLLGLTFQSEYLYLFWSMLALACMAAFSRLRNNQALYLAALSVAAATLTRTIGITLLVPLFLSASRTPRKTAVLIAFIACVPLMLWSAMRHQGGSYLGSLFLTYKDHPLSQLRDQLAVEGRALRLGFEQNFALASEHNLLLDSLGALALAGAAVRAGKLKPDGVYVATYLCLLLVWPYPDEARRFVWAIVPVLLGQSIFFMASRSANLAGEWRSQTATAAVGATILLGCLPAITLASDRERSAGDFGRPQARGMLYWYEADAARAERWVETEALITEALRRIDLEVPSKDCVLSVRPELIQYFSHRHSTSPPQNSVPEPEFSRQLKAPNCRYVFMTRRTYAGFPEPMHPLQRMGKNLKIVDHYNLPLARHDNGDWIAALATLD